MLESKYLYTFDLFRSIPTHHDRTRVTDDIFEWNSIMKTSSHCTRRRSQLRTLDTPQAKASRSDVVLLGQSRVVGAPADVAGEDQF